MSETFELELDRRPFAQLSCQAFEAPDETFMCRFEARQASAERAGMVWPCKMPFAGSKKCLALVIWL